MQGSECFERPLGDADEIQKLHTGLLEKHLRRVIWGQRSSMESLCIPGGSIRGSPGSCSPPDSDQDDVRTVQEH